MVIAVAVASMTVICLGRNFLGWLPLQMSGEKQLDSLPGVLTRVRFWADARDP
jgi:hypothetical protein